MSTITDYDEFSSHYDLKRGPSDAYIMKSILENFTGKTVKEMDIIDIGCGTGNYADYFLQFEPRSISLMDASEGMLSKAKAKLPSDHPKTKLSFKQVALPEMPYGDNQFDAAMINLVLHHLEENPDGKTFPVLSKTLKEVFRILKPGGVLTILYLTPLQLDAFWFSHLVPENTKQWMKKLVTHKQLRSYLEESGFSLKSSFKTVMPAYLPDMRTPENVEIESYRRNLAFFGTCTKSEIEAMLQYVARMKKEGTLKQFHETHYKTDIVGLLDIVAAKKEIK